MSKTRPGLALTFMAFMFSLAEIPPLFGFYPKLAVFNAAVAAGLFPLAVLAVVGSVIGASYYIRIVTTMYFDDPAPAFAVSGSAIENGLIAATALASPPAASLEIPAPTGWGTEERRYGKEGATTG